MLNVVRILDLSLVNVVVFFDFALFTTLFLIARTRLRGCEISTYDGA